jgi:basic amino acid/polyamine antiporter, APA family
LVVISAVLIKYSDYFQKNTIFDLLTDCIVFAASLFYALAVAAVIVLRRTQPNIVRPFRTPGYPWVPILYLIVYAWFIAMIFLDKRVEACAGIVLIALGIPFYLWQERRCRS